MARELNLTLKLTNKAISQMEQIFGITSKYDYTERVADILLQLLEDEYYDYYLQNATRDGDEETKVTILMASDTGNPFNLRFIDKYHDKILVFVGVNIDKNDFLIINIKLLPKPVGANSNKSILTKIKFDAYNTIKTSSMPGDILRQIAEMPNAQDLYRKVDKNIKDWDDYLAIIERNAMNSQLEIEYKGFKQEDSLTHCVFYFDRFNPEQIEKLKRFRNERVVLFYTSFQDKEHWDYIEDFIGTIDKINFKKDTIKLELEPGFQELALEGELDFPQTGHLRISQMGDLAQARNLRRGLHILKTGQAHNPDLDVLLFNSKTLGDNIENKVTLEDNNLLLQTLNEKQKAAVEGVLNAKDLYLIQGPPGTGKTTVIAEICYQNALRGKKTLISSQSNLAVDNALSRLVHNPKIRALRKGNLSKVEKEGEKYTENNVVDTWLNKTADLCSHNFENTEKYLEKINTLEVQLDNICSNYEMKSDLESSILETEKIIEHWSNISHELLVLKNDFEDYFSAIEEEIELNEISPLLGDLWDLITGKLSNLAGDEETVFPAELQKEFKFIYDKIERTLALNSKKMAQKKDIEEKSNKIFKILGLINVDNYKKVKEYLPLLESNGEHNKFIALIEENKTVKKAISSNISQFKKAKNKVNEKVVLLDKLKNEYNIRNVMVAEETSAQGTLSEQLIEFEKNVANLYNFKPSKLLALLGFKRKWKVNVIKSLSVGEHLKDLIGTEIDSLYKELSSIEENTNDIKKQLTNLLDRTYGIYEQKIEEIENEISLNVKMIHNLKPEYEKLKTSILYETTWKILYYRFTLSLSKVSLEAQIYESNRVKNEIQNFNEEISSICDVKLSLKKIAKRKNIKAFYLDLLVPTKEGIFNYVQIVGEWIKRIRAKRYGDKEELKDLYINTANVIGITCVQSGNKDFTEKYPDFDVVIVDEVSKATPPELVLPMLKGKKLVLVGDHKQLPPMIGDETFLELKQRASEEKNVDSEVDDLEYMKRSLFEELFTNLSGTNKVMLNTQYRMHSSIMHTINQFYMDSQNKGLNCGVEDEDLKKNHMIETHYLNDKSHLLWVDIPLHPNYFEKVNGRNSYYNETEVEVIDKMLQDFNENCENLGQKKEVAVITFYSGQARLLQKEIVANNKYKNLKLRIGTVDRFQGMEREIVIVSFVRNNNKGKIGFARDPRRINVALSRAQNLLVIVGCSELFCVKNHYKEARENYKSVLKVVDNYSGIIDAKVVFN